MSDITYKLTAATNVGKVRTNNEDNFIVSPNLDDNDWLVPKDTNMVLDLDGNGCLLVVADGMGGMNAGEVASEIAVESIKDVFSSFNLERIRNKSRSVRKFLEKAIETADKNIKKRVESNPETQGMGTTVVIAWVVDGYAYIAWCGDSRAYCYNGKNCLKRLTKDHSYVQDLVDSGRLDPGMAFDHPNSNIITRSLGDSSSKANPDSTVYKLMPGDIILLCSDGLCGLCRDEEIESVIDVCNKDDIEEIKTSLISAALDAGGYDNVTVALFQCISAEVEILNSTVSNFVRENAEEKPEDGEMCEEKPQTPEPDKTENSSKPHAKSIDSTVTLQGPKKKTSFVKLFLLTVFFAIIAYAAYLLIIKYNLTDAISKWL